MLDHPSLARELTGTGDIIVADTRRERVVVIDRRSKDIIWQYGVTDYKGHALGLPELSGPIRHRCVPRLAGPAHHQALTARGTTRGGRSRRHRPRRSVRLVGAWPRRATQTPHRGIRLHEPPEATSGLRRSRPRGV
jgi:hypothetical protein